MDFLSYSKVSLILIKILITYESVNGVTWKQEVTNEQDKQHYVLLGYFCSARIEV